MTKRRFLRTCQECGYVQVAKSPASYKDQNKESWRDTKCKKCKSEALDYGSYERIPEDDDSSYEDAKGNGDFD